MNQDKAVFMKAVHDKIQELPFHRLLGLNSGSFDTEHSSIRFDMRDELIGNVHFKILHGGVIAAILDAESGFVLSLDGAWHPVAGSVVKKPLLRGGTIDMRIDYLRPGKGKHFVATGTIVRRGNKVAVVRTELRNELDELIAVGTASYLIG